jgi:predicted transcriptional regulator
LPSSAPLKLASEDRKLETAISLWFSKRRDQLHIVTEILEVAKHGASKTCIMYNANLNFKGVNQYLTFMMKNKLLLKTLEECKPVYYASEKGLTFLSGYTQLVQLLQ